MCLHMKLVILLFLSALLNLNVLFPPTYDVRQASTCAFFSSTFYFNEQMIAQIANGLQELWGRGTKNNGSCSKMKNWR